MWTQLKSSIDQCAVERDWHGRIEHVFNRGGAFSPQGTPDFRRRKSVLLDVVRGIIAVLLGVSLPAEAHAAAYHLLKVRERELEGCTQIIREQRGTLDSLMHELELALASSAQSSNRSRSPPRASAENPPLPPAPPEPRPKYKGKPDSRSFQG